MLSDSINLSFRSVLKNHVQKTSGITLVCAGVLALTSAATAGGDGVIIPQPKMGEHLPGLTAQQLAQFHIGKIKYNTPLLANEGLGPVFNKNTCGNCHNNPLGGPGSQTVTRYGLDDKAGFDPLAEYGGSLLQASSITPECEEVIPVEANVTQFRVTNGALAYGLVEAITDAAILAVRDKQPLAQRGVAHMVGAFEDPPASPLRVGRFGWKAQVATVLTFSADASLNEMGLTNEFILVENDPNGERPPALGSPDYCDVIPDPEDNLGLGNGVDKNFIQVVTDFQRFLAPFPQTPKSGMSGEAIFTNAIGKGGVGCAVCHTPAYVTSNAPRLEEALRNKAIRPYSDWLLHNMGQTGDPIVQGEGIEQMVKTPPLWGLRVRDPLWHDGRVAGGTFEDRVRAAIALHNPPGPSQGKASAMAFEALSLEDQNQLIAFLGSLGQAEFDSDQNQVIDLLDFQAMRPCAGAAINPDHPCAIYDIDQDGDLDLSDFQSFMLVFAGPRRDCNSNGVLDLQEILFGALPDANNNSIPDGCEPTCDADVNGSGNVNVNDLLAVINGWGPCPPLTQPCGADINYDHAVNVNDLLAVINAWGNCPQ